MHIIKLHCNYPKPTVMLCTVVRRVQVIHTRSVPTVESHNRLFSKEGETIGYNLTAAKVFSNCE